MADDAFLLDVEAGWGQVVLVRLTRFLLRTDCTVEALDWELVTVLDAAPAMVDSPMGGVAVPVEIVTKRRTVDHNRLHVVAGGPRYRRAGSVRDHQVDRQAGLNHCVQDRAGS